MSSQTCKKAREALWREAGSREDLPEGNPLQQHLDSCPDCRRLQEENRQTVAWLREDVTVDPGPEFWQRLNCRIMDQVRNEAALPQPWYRRSWFPLLSWPVYAGAPALALLILTMVWFGRGAAPDPKLLTQSATPALKVTVEDIMDPLVDPIYSLTPGQTRLLDQRVVAGLARDLKTRAESPVEAVLDWDLNNNLDGLTNEELDKLANKLQTVGPTGNKEVVQHVS